MPTRSARRPMRSRTKIIACCVIVVVVLGVGGVLVTSWIIDRLPALRVSVQREFRNERLSSYARRLERELDEDQFADLSYSVGLGALNIVGSLPDREALDQVISAVFACPDEVVFDLNLHVNLSDPDVGDLARVRLVSPRAVAEGSARTWALHIDVLELSTEFMAEPDPDNPIPVGLEQRRVILDRQGKTLREEVVWRKGDPVSRRLDYPVE